MYSTAELQQLIEERMSDLRLGERPPTLYEPVHYMLGLGGKRMRPLLTLMSCQLCGGDIYSALIPAIGFELFHNFTLLHDDIMDKAPLRRGRPTVHQKWNLPVAILAGDALFVKSVQFVQHAPVQGQQVMETFLENALLVCEGQQLDMDFESANHISISDYMTMITMKTAVLPAACMKAGALMAGAGSDSADLLYESGKNIGIAFQLKDDLLDVYGDSHTFGKQTGGDILAGKKTFLYLRSLELLSADDAHQLRRIYNQPDRNQDKVDRVKQLFDKAGIQQEIKNQMDIYYRLSLDCLNRVEVNSQRKQPLIDLYAALMSRQN